MRNTTVIFLAIFFLSSCKTIGYVNNHLVENEPGEFETYNLDGECEVSLNQILELRVTNALHQYFRKKGYTQSENPDYLVHYFIKETTQNYITSECDYYGRWIYGDQCAVRFETYKEGSIVIDVVKTKDNSIIWHGAAYGPAFDRIRNPNEKINEYINNLMDKFMLKKK